MDIDYIYNCVVKKYEGKKRLVHILGVANLAKELAIKYGYDPNKAYVAGLLHDYYKYEPVEELLNIINDDYVKEKFKDAKEIYHAYASANSCKEFGIYDNEIVEAIRYHVYGVKNMSLLTKILVVSDFCEESRPYKEAIIVRNYLNDLDKALYYSLYYAINHLIECGKKPMDEQIEIMNEVYDNYKGEKDELIKSNY